MGFPSISPRTSSAAPLGIILGIFLGIFQILLYGLQQELDRIFNRNSPSIPS